MADIKRIIITTGDTDGIGLEVSLKALKKIKLNKRIQYLLFTPPKAHLSLSPLLNTVKNKYGAQAVTNLDLGLQAPARSGLTIIESTLSPAEWVVQAANACVKQQAAALVTAPLSKTLIQSSGMRALGHTEILKSVCKASDVFMCFLGKHFHVLLITGHVALNNVDPSLSENVVKAALTQALKFRNLLPTSQKRKPIALVGLNPHAGEDGLIGTKEQTLLVPLIQRHTKKDFSGPLVPDVAFQKQNWSKYSLYLATYHDQGLIPFKLVHGHKTGVHISLGLPIVRTSVDHGTAKDIFGKNKANPASMLEAIQWADRLS